MTLELSEETISKISAIKEEILELQCKIREAKADAIAQLKEKVLPYKIGDTVPVKLYDGTTSIAVIYAINVNTDTSLPFAYVMFKKINKNGSTSGRLFRDVDTILGINN